jgi:hypothetical protein
LELCAGKSRNISHGLLDEVKEILKKLGDDPFGNKAAVSAANSSKNAGNTPAFTVTGVSRLLA